MPIIIPLRDLKEPSKISNMLRKKSEPVFVTKNGYGDMVLMNIDYYNRIANSSSKNEIYSINEIVKILYPIFVKHNVNTAVLFGSYAKGLATEKSDIDILVDSGLRGLAFYGLLEDISSAFTKNIDLIDIRDVVPNSKIDNEIKNSGVRIFG